MTSNLTFLSMPATAVSAAFLPGGYEFVRVSADSLFITTYGAAQRPDVMVVSAVVTVVFVYIFGRLLSLFGQAYGGAVTGTMFIRRPSRRSEVLRRLMKLCCAALVLLLAIPQAEAGADIRTEAGCNELPLTAFSAPGFEPPRRE